LFAIVFRGVLALSKAEMLTPVLCFLAGYWAINHSLKAVALPLLAAVVVFAFVLVPFVKQGRMNAGYDAASNSVVDRIDIISSGTKTKTRNSEPSVRPLSRLSHSPYQRYLINEYDETRPGESLSDFWVALVPRIFWSDKPVVTRFGRELHEQFNRVRNARSALAPTYSAEAYWNYGAVGVLIVSVLMGLQFGWLTKCWFYAVQGRGKAYLAIAFPAVFLAFNVEAWIAASYVGGFVTLLIIWLIVWLSSLVVGTRK